MSLKKSGEEEALPIVARGSVGSVEQGDPFSIKFVGASFAAIFPYHCLQEAKLIEDTLSLFFSNGVEIQCYGTNLLPVLDSIWNARLMVVEARPERMDTPLMEGEVLVERIEYIEEDEEEGER